MVIIGGIGLHKTRFGRYTYAIGSNEISARRVGINVDRKLVQIYALSGTLAGLAGKPKDELLTAMTQFKQGKKPATLMHQLAKGYSDEEIAALADHFSKQPR